MRAGARRRCCASSIWLPGAAITSTSLPMRVRCCSRLPQKAHPNAVHGRSVEEENHFIPKDAITALMRTAEQNGGKIDWVNCGLCVDERGAVDAIAGVRR